MDTVVQIVRQGPGSLTPVSLRGKTERMIEIVTAGATEVECAAVESTADVSVVLTKRVAQ